MPQSQAPPPTLPAGEASSSNTTSQNNDTTTRTSRKPPPARMPSGRRSTRLQTVITSLCIAANSLTAGSMFCFPLIGPSIMADLSLSLKQTNTIWVGAVLGEYISAAFWGALADSYGPRPLSFAAAICFGAGYSLMAHGDARAIRQKHQDILDLRIADVSRTRDWVPTGYGALTFYFVLVGVGVAASYFSAVTSATRLFPRHPSLAIALPLTLFSLSSLFLTTIGSSFFVDATTGDLDASSFLTFLAVLLSVTNLVSTFGMRPPSVVVLEDEEEDEEEDGETLQPGRRKKITTAPRQSVHELNETTPLLPRELGEAEASSSSHSISATAAASNISLVPKSDSLRDFLRTPSVWILAVLMFTAVGGAEMVMSSVGNMVVSLIGGHALPGGGGKNLPGPGLNNDALKWRSLQVQLLATANTLSRLISGLLADFFSPARPLVTMLPSSSAETSKLRSFLRMVYSKINNIRVSRMTILLGATSLLTVTFTYAATMLNSLPGLVFVSIAVGCGYGFSFTLVPSIVASAFGLRTFGRSWGLLSYACAAGSLSFSLLYAVVSDAASEPDTRQRAADLPNATLFSHSAPASPAASNGICLQGRHCFQVSFALAAVGTAAATLLAIPLRNRWKAYL